MSKTRTTKASTIFAYFLFTILFTIFFALLSACGGGSDKNGSGSGSSDPVEEPVEEPDPSLFRSTWRVPADSKTITLPLVNGHNYNFTVDWGDGSPISEITEHNDPDKTHTYAAAGDYNLLIEGLLEAWSFNNAEDGDKDKIRSVEDFGDLDYKNLSGAFHGCTNLEDFKGGVTSDVTDMSSMFEGATSANPDVSNWDVSSVTNMTSMFDDSALSTANYNAFLINLADNNALVENVTLGVGTIQYDSFAARTALDTLVDDRGWTITDGGPADSIGSFRSTWKTSANNETITLPLVDDAAYTYNFTVDWRDDTAISTITSFDDAAKTHTYETAGDHDIVIKGTLEAWSFNNAGDKNKILSVESFGDLGYKNLSGAFQGCTNLTAFEGGITSDVTDMSFMFASTNNATPDVSSWNVSSVTNMASMFSGALMATPYVNDWDVSAVTDMNIMFGSALKAIPYVSNWDVSSVTNMSGMFFSAVSADPDVSSWVVSSVTDMASMFLSAINANPDMSSWNVSSVTDMNSMLVQDCLQQITMLF